MERQRHSIVGSVVRPDVRLENGPMTAVSCTTCGAGVEARKSSWDQTSIQWSSAALEACVERRASSQRPGPNGATFLGCAALNQALREAAVHGDLPVQDTDALRTNPLAGEAGNGHGHGHVGGDVPGDGPGDLPGEYDDTTERQEATHR